MDSKPVFIHHKKGLISKIVSHEKISNVPKLLIAPGLIDIQINGYMGVDFF